MLKKLTVVVAILVALVITGCINTTENGAGPTTGAKIDQPVKIQTEDFVVYRIPKNGTEILVPEKVKHTLGDKTKYEVALSALINTEPTEKTLQNLFPPGTALLGVKVENSLATADFNKAFAKKREGSYEEFMMVNSIVMTLTEFPEVKRVQILVEGKKVTTLNGHMDLIDPLTRNKTLLK